jgi:hypothetical protein
MSALFPGVSRMPDLGDLRKYAFQIPWNLENRTKCVKTTHYSLQASYLLL